MESQSERPPERLRPYERFTLIFGFVLLVAFGVLITARSAFMMNPKTDFQVYARAGWAVRSGADIYDVIDNNGWHFAYPPAFAVAMVPLGDPYPFLPREGYLPFAASVAIWYVLNVLAIGYAANTFASLLSPGLARGSRAWWFARTMPALFCIGALGHTLGRGQVNTVVVALVAAGFAATMRNRRFLGGAWLAAAAVVKIIPAIFILAPLVRRDGRGLVGYAAAGVVLMVGVPMAVWGPAGAKDTTVKMVEVVLGPVFSDAADHTREKELHGTAATDNQSVQASVHAWIHPDRETRPPKADRLATYAHLGIAGIVLLVTAVAGHRRRRSDDPANLLLFLGCTGAAMLVVTPVSHMHYYAFLHPLVAGLWLRHRNATTVRYTILLWAVFTHVPLFPGPVFDRFRECGMGIAATLALWGVGIAALLGVFGRTHGGNHDSGTTSAWKRFSPFTLQS